MSLYDLLEALVLSCIPAKYHAKNVAGQNVLVTGAGSGLGRGVSIEFAKLGANLILWDINKDGNDETASMVRAHGVEAHAYVCDLSNKDDVYAVGEKVKTEVGQVDILINNAGIVTGRKFLDSPDSLIQKTMDININAHFWTAKLFLKGMIERKQGHLVTIASAAGLNGVTGLADYCASKYAAVGFDEAIRMELYALGLKDIHTTVICPYYINTGMFTGVKSRFNAILPIMEPQFVIGKIVDAVLTNKQIVILPKIVNFVTGLKYFLPAKAALRLNAFFGVCNSMDDFVGRSKTD